MTANENLDDGITSKSADLLVIEEITKFISAYPDTEVFIKKTLRLLSQSLGLNRGRVLLRDRNSGQLKIKYSYGLTDAEKERGVFNEREGITGKVFSSGQIAIVQDINADNLYLGKTIKRDNSATEVISFIALPIFDRHNMTTGVLAVHRLRDRQRSFDDDINTLRVVATLISQQLQIQQLIEEKTSSLASENSYLKNALTYQNTYGVIGESNAIKNVLRQVQQFINIPIPVLITGESGTGKEKIARMLHIGSKRKDAAFITVNCSAIPNESIDAELFGQVTEDASGVIEINKGKLELASGGTLFLDEIGDLDIEVQPRLLRAFEEGIITRVGADEEIRIDIRLIAATHKNLQEEVNRGNFRLDLFYRLNVLPLELPPLRERFGDIPLLARHFLNAANHAFNRNASFTAGVLEKLESYNWPGNIRQLENVVKRAVLTSPGDEITTDAIENILHHESAVNPGKPSNPDRRSNNSGKIPAFDDSLTGPIPRPYVKVDADDRQVLLDALKNAGGNKTRAALSLGMTPRQFSYRLEKLDIKI